MKKQPIKREEVVIIAFAKIPGVTVTTTREKHESRGKTFNRALERIERDMCHASR